MATAPDSLLAPLADYLYVTIVSRQPDIAGIFRAESAVPGPSPVSLHHQCCRHIIYSTISVVGLRLTAAFEVFIPPANIIARLMNGELADFSWAVFLHIC